MTGHTALARQAQEVEHCGAQEAARARRLPWPNLRGRRGRADGHGGGSRDL